MTASGEVAGFCDGLKGGHIYGWAWFPNYPDLTVDIELLVDGEFIAEVAASDYRPDLRAAGVGHGRYGWRFPKPAGVSAASLIVVRAKDGSPLAKGEFRIGNDDSDEASQDEELTAFVAAVLGQKGKSAPNDPPSPPKIHFLLYAPVIAGASTLGTPEYSYGFVLKAFEPMLKMLGDVHIVKDIEQEADALYMRHISRGETSILLSFAPPHRTVLGLRCPLVPVIAWEFPTLPNRVWAEERRHDWRFVLRQTGRAIALSSFAAEAIKAAMGEHFPVIGLPAPVWDRFAAVRAPDLRQAANPLDIVVDGFVFDTKGRQFEPTAATPKLPRRREDAPAGAFEDSEGEALASSITLDGVVFTAVFSPKDGRKNWPDMVTSFLAAHRDKPDAMLVLKMIGSDPTLWWWELHDILGRQLPFLCRIVVLEGYLSDDNYNDLISATHWIACSSHAEGLCMPLVEFMSAGRPAISPRHTAMLDYITAENALIVESDEEYCGWPHDPDNEMTTTRHRVSWPSLIEAFAQGYDITKNDPDNYFRMGRSANDTLKSFCSDEVVSMRLKNFLGLNLANAPALDLIS